MDGKRQQKINKLIKQELSEVFQRECSNLVQGKLITITIVRISSDLGIAKIYASIMPESSSTEIIRLINSEIASVRFALGNRLRNHLRKIPTLRFYQDDTAQYADKMDRLFNELDIPESAEDDELLD